MAINDHAELCTHCMRYKATDRWASDATAAIHGWTAWWCKRCVLRAQIEAAEEMAARLPDLREQLTRLGEE